MNITAKKPTDYKHIAAWGRMLRSFHYYVTDQQARAFAAGAPIDAIYEKYANDGSGPTGEWVTVDECKPDTVAEVNAIVATYSKG